MGSAIYFGAGGGSSHKVAGAGGGLHIGPGQLANTDMYKRASAHTHIHARRGTTRAHAHSVPVYVHICAHTCAQRTYIYACARTHTHNIPHMNKPSAHTVPISIHIHTPAHAPSTGTYTHPYIYIHVYTHTHTHTHTRGMEASQSLCGPSVARGGRDHCRRCRARECATEWGWSGGGGWRAGVTGV